MPSGICKKIIKTHFRGIIGGLGVLASLIFLIVTVVINARNYPKIQSIAIKTIWFCMFWCFLWQPFDAPVTGLIPIFISPMIGDMSTAVVVSHYFNDSIGLYLFMRIIGQAMSQSGADVRIITNLLSCGSVKSFSLKKLIWRVSFIAFLMSMVTNRQVSTPLIMEYVCSPIVNLETQLQDDSKVSGLDLRKVRYMLATVVHTSSVLGSLVFIHSSPSMMMFRAAFVESAKVHYPDVFNYMGYTSFAAPIALIMLFSNISYHLILTSIAIKGNMNLEAMTHLKSYMQNHQHNVPTNWTAHEILAILFQALTLSLLLFRFPIWINGWAMVTTSWNSPLIQDSTVAAVIILLLHLLPTNLNFCKLFAAKQKSELPPEKPTTGLLEWRFVDKKCNYSYIFLFGGSLALHHAFASGKCYVGEEISYTLDGLSYVHPLLIVFTFMLLSVVLCNIMTGVAAAACIMPIALFLHVSWDGPFKEFYLLKPYLVPLCVSLATCLGFMAPFTNTPAFYSRAFGEVPILQMIKWGIGSVLICFIILVPAVYFYAPIVFGEFHTNIMTKAISTKK